ADKFNDVEDSFWAAEDIYLLKEAGIINGKSASEFDPEGKVTRAEFTKMIAQLFGVEAISGAVKFEDCGDADWFTPYVAAAVEAGLVTGYSDTEFAPDKTITREEACTIIGRGLKAVAEGELTFTDASDVSDYAAEYVAILAAKGFINGYEDGSFLPANEITRAESAKIVANVFKSLKAEAETEVEAEAEAEAETEAEEVVEAE
ncbi:MAG: S-layer homology domain-containing protein, partial [Clostridia bacterium]|nr:S-layer homology domain-containing protein [Clostridia bacterium]